MEILFSFKNFFALLFPLLFPLSNPDREEKLDCVCALVVSLMMNPGFCLLLFLIFSFVYSSLSPVTDCNEHGKTHTSPMESLPGLLVCAGICVHSIISPGSGRN